MSTWGKPWTFEPFDAERSAVWTVYDGNLARIVAVFHDEDEVKAYLKWRNKKQAKRKARKAAAPREWIKPGGPVTDRDGLLAVLERTGRRHGWAVTRNSLGYYALRFTRDDGTIGVRVTGGKITEVTVDVGGQHYQLRLPVRAALEEILARPLPRPDVVAAEPDDRDKLDLIRRWLHPGLWSGLDGRREAFLSILDGKMVEPPDWTTPGRNVT